MSIKYPETIDTLSPNQRQFFYELFAHQLTSSIRGILFTEELSDAERIDQAKWLNEISHRITFNIFFMHMKSPQQLDELQILEMINQNVEKNPAIEEAVATAIMDSYSLTRQYAEVDSKSANNS